MICAKLLRDPRSDLWYHGLSEPWLVYIFPPDKLESSSFATQWNSENLFSTQRSSVSQIIFFLLRDLQSESRSGGHREGGMGAIL